MAQFYFDLHQCGTVTLDVEGADLRDLDTARQRAIAAARDVMMGELAGGTLCLGCAIVVRDADRVAVLDVPFVDAVSVTFAKGSDCH